MCGVGVVQLGYVVTTLCLVCLGTKQFNEASISMNLRDKQNEGFVGPTIADETGQALPMDGEPCRGGLLWSSLP